MAQIIKTRYCLCYNNQYFEIDIYPTNENEAILEIELNDEHANVDIPDYLSVLKEVTDNPEYRNFNIAKRLVKR